MAKITHNISNPNDGLGDQLRTGFSNQNLMNTELYDTKVDKVTGKGLSANDFSNTDKAKLDALNLGAEVNVQPDWAQSNTLADDFIKNKPTIESSFSAIYIERFLGNGINNTFTLPLGAQVVNLNIDRGVKYKFSEWTQTDNIVTVLGDILAINSDVYMTGMRV